MYMDITIKNTEVSSQLLPSPRFTMQSCHLNVSTSMCKAVTSVCCMAVLVAVVLSGGFTTSPFCSKLPFLIKVHGIPTQKDDYKLYT
ncbi:hypothetical protein MSG28_000792 [Choristoneura fumiferana]|uniref:Uncharacterized protein n=1 Tax=Choristoneura fumiferana TaxID=7141 RepID=A0ACC0K2W4_CHOFU|nr:hypothetical protein MSG28_000792 [Choristoneura fumiferana]